MEEAGGRAERAGQRLPGSFSDQMQGLQWFQELDLVSEGQNVKSKAQQASTFKTQESARSANSPTKPSPMEKKF